MTVKQLKEKLNEFPDDMPVATFNDISWQSKDDPNWIEVKKCVWECSNYLYDKPDFEYINLI